MFVSEEQMKKIEEFALEKVSKLNYNHDKDHIIRTVKFVEILAKKENADLEVCRVAAFLHDIGQSIQFENHEELSVEMAKDFLKSLNLDNEFIEKVCHAIKCHNNDYIKNAKTIEAKVLYDADKLQVVGVFGFTRLFSDFVGLNNMTLKDAMEKVHRIQEERFKIFQTKSAKEMIKKPHEFMKEFYELYEKWDKVDL